MTPPVLSVVVATYNRLPELRTMLDSLLPQVQGKPVEVLIADDRSTDATWEWLQSSFSGAAQIRRFRMEENGGPGPARNLCLRAALGRYFIPIDSDFILIDDAIDRVLAAIREDSRYQLFFFPCVEYPAMRRIGRLDGRCEIGYGSFMAEELGEMVPVASLDWLRLQGLVYPAFRAGGEGLLWAEMLAHNPALFVDTPVVYYRTDVAQRICTLAYQLDHPADLAAIADATLALLARTPSAAPKAVQAHRCLAAGSYHLLAGNMREGRRRLVSAVSLGSLPAVAALAASFAGKDLFRKLFRIYRTRIANAYL